MRAGPACRPPVAFGSDWGWRGSACSRAGPRGAEDPRAKEAPRRRHQEVAAAWKNKGRRRTEEEDCQETCLASSEPAADRHLGGPWEGTCHLFCFASACLGLDSSGYKKISALKNKEQQRLSSQQAPRRRRRRVPPRRLTCSHHRASSHSAGGEAWAAGRPAAAG